MKKPYRGALSEPIKRQKPANALRERYEQARKWGALFAHYNIPIGQPNNWFFLANALAREHVPGFRVVNPPGKRPSPKQVTLDVMLCAELGRAELSNKSIKAAAARLVRRPGRFKGRSAEGLRQRYYLIRNIDKPEGERMYRLIAHITANAVAAKKL